MTDAAKRAGEDEIEASKAPLLDHLIELRTRLIYAIAAFVGMMIVSFFFSKYILQILLIPYGWAAGGIENVGLQATHPLEVFFTELKLAAFGGAFLSFPVVATQIYRFIAPGLYKNEKDAFLPYLVATPVLFLLGTAVVFFIAMPLLMKFSLAQVVAPAPGIAPIKLDVKVSEYLSLIMTLIFAFGITFQLPILLTLLGRVGIIDSAFLVEKRRYAIVIVFVIAAVLTPPDVLSQVALALPTLLLYEGSIFAVRMVEKKRAQEEAARKAAEAG